MAAFWNTHRHRHHQTTTRGAMKARTSEGEGRTMREDDTKHARRENRWTEFGTPRVRRRDTNKEEEETILPLRPNRRTANASG